MQDGIVAEALIFLEVNGLEDLMEFIGVQEADDGFLGAFFGDVQDCFGEFCFFGVHKADHFCERLDGGQALIPGSGGIFALPFKVIQEGQDEIDG